jgi:hypothetical protein
VVLNGVSAPDRSYRWLFNGSAVSGNLTPTLTANASGAYRLIVTNAVTGCFDTSAAVSVTVNPIPAAQISPVGSLTRCVGDSVTLNATTGTGFSYVWLLNGSVLTGSTQAGVRVGAAGSYRVLITNSVTGCFDTSAAVSVVIVPLPTATVSAAGSTTLCEGNTVVLNANTGTGLTYSWLRNGVAISGQTSASLTASLAGSYRVVVTNATGCFDTSAALTVTVNPKPAAPVLTTNADTIFASPGTDLLWFRDGILLAGVTDSTLIITQNGSYRALRLSAQGCNSDSSNAIVVTNVAVADEQVLQARIYPNPTAGLLILQLESSNQEALEIEFRSVTGALVYQKRYAAGSYTDREQLQLDELPPAVYLVQLRQGERLKYQRLVIQR